MNENRKVGKFLRLIPVLLLMLLIGVAGIESRGDRRSRSETVKKERKGKQDGIRRAARHYFLAGVQQTATGHNAEAAELFKKAYQLDSTYSEAALEYGMRRWGMPSDTLATPAEQQRSKRIARKFVDHYPSDFFPNVYLSNMMVDRGDFEEAIEILERLREGNPSNSDVLMQLSMLYLDTRDFDKSLEALNSYGRIEGEDIEFLIRKAGMMLAMGDTVGALAETDRMIAEHPADVQYTVFKGQLYGYIGQPDSALTVLRRAEAMEEPGLGGPVKIQLADQYRAIGDSAAYDEKIYEALMAEDLEFDVKRDLLTFYLQSLISDNADRARGDRLFDVVQQQYPHEPDILALASRYNASRGNYAKAAEEIGYALDMDRTNISYWENAILYYLLLEDYRGVDSVFTDAHDVLDRTPLRFFALAGNAAIVEENYDRAIRIFQHALDENFPGQKLDAPADQNVLRTFLTVDNFNDLVSIYQEAGDAYYKMKRNDLAFLNYENALALDDQNTLLLNNYAYFIVDTPDSIPAESLARADEMSKRAVTLNPENPTYLDTRAWVLFRMGEYHEAKELEQRALEQIAEDIPPEEEAEYRSHLGDILFMTGDPAGAVEEWKKALEGRPDDELLKKKVRHRTFYYQ